MSTADDDLGRGAAAKLRSTKGSMAAYRGHLTRLYRQIDSMTMESPVAMQTKASALETVFKSYEEMCFVCLQSIGPSIEREVIASNYREEYERFQKFNERFIDWSQEVESKQIPRLEYRTTASLPEYHAVDRDFPRRPTASVDRFNMQRGNTPKKTTSVDNDVQSSKAGQSGRKSLASQRDLQMAQLKIKQLEEEQQLMDIKREMENQRLELKKRILDARFEAEKAELLAKLEDDEQDDRSSISHVPKQSSADKVEKYLLSNVPNADDRSVASSSWPRPPPKKESAVYTPTLQNPSSSG